MNNKQEYILYSTHQAWKYFVPMLLDFIGIIIGILSFNYYSDTQRQLLYLMVALSFLTISFIIKYNIRCPKCGTSWYWLALKKPMSEHAIVKIRSLASCPTCGFTNDSIT